MNLEPKTLIRYVVYDFRSIVNPAKTVTFELNHAEIKHLARIFYVAFWLRMLIKWLERVLGVFSREQKGVF